MSTHGFIVRDRVEVSNGHPLPFDFAKSFNGRIAQIVEHDGVVDVWVDRENTQMRYVCSPEALTRIEDEGNDQLG